MTDQKFEKSIFDQGLRRYKRDSLHFKYDNDGVNGYIRKGAGTRPPRRYDTTRYCIFKKFQLIRDGFDLFLTSNSVILIYDDLPLDYIFSYCRQVSLCWFQCLQQDKWTWSTS